MTEPAIMRLDNVSEALREYYSACFEKHGATARGVGWSGEDAVRLRYDKMLAVLERDNTSGARTPTLLDVGCGYGGLLQRAQERSLDIDYTGIDVAENMILHARETFTGGRFILGDVFELDEEKPFDYVVCNGILTQKLDTSIVEMEAFARGLVRKMFRLCHVGIAFNVMTNLVDYTASHLYYKSPVELLAFCLGELSRYVKIDHAYPLYEYTTYVFTGPEAVST